MLGALSLPAVSLSNPSKRRRPYTRLHDSDQMSGNPESRPRPALPARNAAPLRRSEPARRRSHDRAGLHSSPASRLLQPPGNSVGVVAGLAETGPGSATPATSFFPSKARRVLPWGLHRPGCANVVSSMKRNASPRNSRGPFSRIFHGEATPSSRFRCAYATRASPLQHAVCTRGPFPA